MENGKIKRIFEGVKAESQLEWLDANVLRGGQTCEVIVAANEEEFDITPYVGEVGYARIERLRSGQERSLNGAEMALACGKQQILELLMCLYVFYGRDIDMNALFFIGMTLPRLLQGPVGYVYAEWAKFELRAQLHRDVTMKTEDLRRQLQQAEQVCYDEAVGRKILDQYRGNVLKEVDLGLTCPQKQLDGNYPLFVQVHASRGEYGPMIKLDPREVSKSNKEGIVELIPGATKLSQFIGPDLELPSVVRTTACIDLVQKTSEIGFFQPPKFDWDVRIPTPKLELYTPEDYVQMQSCVADGMAVELARINALEEIEQLNRIEHVDQPIDDLAKSAPSSHFVKSIDIHTLYQDIGLNRVLGVVWRGDRLDRVERVVITSTDGMVMMNTEFRGMPEDFYLNWMYLVRIRAFTLLAGTNVYGFNVSQHLSKLGLGGMKNKLIDMLQLPQLKGKYASKSIENYQLRYYRTSEELVERDDPVMDNVLFCAFLVRRWGIDWKFRRRKRVASWVYKAQ